MENRLPSLDGLRGLAVSAMILVNNPGTWAAVYAPLQHAAWHGCRGADFVFPFFVFVLGVSVVCAFSVKKREQSRHRTLLKKIALRSLILCCLGLFLNGFPEFDLATWRIPGILQRIGIVYFICAVIYLKTDIRTQGAVAAALLLVYWLLLTAVPVPGIGAANLEPETNLAAWLDRAVLGNHLWRETRLWDPEGILSTLGAVATGLIGVVAGGFTGSRCPERVKPACLILSGAVMSGAGLLWHLVLPINKTLWTGSYVLFTAGIALVFFGAGYFMLDIKKATRTAAPFMAMGRNALFLFFLSSLAARTLSAVAVRDNITLKQWLFDNLFSVMPSAHLASLAGAVTFVLFFLLIAWIMYRYKIFIKV